MTIVDDLIGRSPESAPLAVNERAAARSIAVPTYRADIDGLRAVAVLLVVGFHAFPATVTGGFIGVDIFFVISGFLITGIILREREAGRFSYRIFYARRIKRIFPALIFVLIAVLIGGWFLLLPPEYSSLGKNASAGAGFSANFTLLSEAGYFDIAADRKPLLHLWSLGIEEQFYIVWPALLILLMRTRRSLLVAIGTIAIASFGIGVWRLRVDPSGAFYLPDGRAWELLVGAMLAVGGQSLRLPRCLHDFGAVIGCALIGVVVATLKTGSSFPGLWAVPPVVGAALLICCERSWINRRLLTSPTCVAIGLISYPLYLWHWPLLAFARISTDPGKPSDKMLWTLVVTSVVLAWLTYLLVERPIRFGHSRGRRITALAAAMAGVAGLGSTVWAMGGFDIRFPAEVRPLLAGFLDPARIFHSQWRVNDCFITATSSNWRFADICAGEGRQPLVLLWGSSAAAALYPGLRGVQEEYGFGLAQYTAGSCDPVLGMRDGQPPYCQPINQFVIRKIDELKPDIILMHATWDTYSVPFLDATMAELRKHTAARIILVGREPVWGYDSPDGLPGVYTQYARTHPGSPILPERVRVGKLNEEQTYETATREKAQSLGLEYFSVRDVLCDQTGCLTRVGDLPDGATTFDQFHLSLAASRHVAQPLAQRLFSSSKHLNVSSAAD